MNVQTLNNGMLSSRLTTSASELNIKQLHEEVRAFNKLPYALDEVDKVDKMIKEEERSSRVVKLKSLKMDEQGKMDGIFYLNNQSLRKLASFLPVTGSATFLQNADPGLRAWTFNKMVKDLDRNIQVHMRTFPRPEIISATGERFKAVDCNELLNGLKKNINPLSKAEWSYNPNNLKLIFTELKHFDFDALEDVVRGDPHKFGYTFDVNDRGFGAINSYLTVFRHACANMALLSGTNFSFGRIVHRGEYADKLSDMEDHHREYINNFAESYKTAYKTEIKGSVIDVFKKLVSNNINLKIPAEVLSKYRARFNRDEMTIPDSESVYLHNYEGGLEDKTVVDVFNALTSAARDFIHIHPPTQYNIQKGAGAYLASLQR